jgi:predicted permease
MSLILQDIRYAGRTLAKTPGFTLLCVLTIAFGVGANTAVFSMVNGVLLRRLPYAANDRLIHIQQPSSTAPHIGISVPELQDLRAQVGELAATSEYHSMPFQFYGRGEPQRLQTGLVSDNFFDMLGVRPLLGRLFLPGEENVGAPGVLVLGHRYWMQHFAGDPGVIGAQLTMNDRVHTVVGVLPPLPAYPGNNDVWMPAGSCPFRSSPQVLNSRNGRMLQVYAAMKPGQTLEQARTGLTNVAQRLHAEYPANYPTARQLTFSATSVREEMTSRSRPLFFTLLGMAGFVLLIAAANFANLTLARQLRRGHEIALRSALGADRSRIFRQLVTESLFVTVLGGALGVLIAWSGLGLLRAFATRVTPRAEEITLDPAVLGFALAVSIVVGLVAALTPVGRSPALSIALRDGAVSTSAGRREGRLRDALVTAQVALAFVLLIGAGLMVRSLVALQRVDGGFETSNVMTARVDLNWSRYTTDPVILQFADGLMHRLRGQPGVQTVAFSSDFPLLNGQPSTQPFQIRGRELASPNDPGPQSDVTVASAEYFKTIGVPLLRGELYSDSDRDTVDVPVVISKRLAETWWAGSDPLGGELSFNGRRWFRVVGVVGDVHQNGPSNSVADQIYLPYFVFAPSDIRVLMRTTAEARSVIPTLRTAVRELDDKQPLTSTQTLDELRGQRLSEPRTTTVLLLSFAVLALAITAGGLGGVVAYGVNQRVNEIGIRVALGAKPGQVLASMMKQGMVIVTVGLGVGVAGALALSRLMSTLLFAVEPNDLLTYVGVAGALLGVALFASWIPARRALRVDPVQALRAR